MEYQYAVNQKQIEKVEHFCHIGSLLSAKLSMDLEIEKRIQIGATALYRPRERVFNYSPANKDGCIQNCTIANFFPFMAASPGYCSGCRLDRWKSSSKDTAA